MEGSMQDEIEIWPSAPPTSNLTPTPPAPPQSGLCFPNPTPNLAPCSPTHIALNTNPDNTNTNSDNLSSVIILRIFATVYLEQS